MSDAAVIKVHALSKTFRLPHEKVTSVKSAVINFYKRDKKYEQQLALDDISLEVKKGEFFGVIGRNGSGKSTLMKLLAGIYEPTAGSITIDGKLTPFIELGVGFNPELTGRENVFLNGALLGFNRKEMLKMYDEIVAFSEIGRFMDQKLKNYSSGMQVRLAFSIAIRAKTDILLLDEVLAVGDQNFQDKCFKYFEEIKKTGTTVVFISHDSAAIERFCDRVAIIDRSKLVDIGDPREMVFKYGAMVAEEEYAKQDVAEDSSQRQGTGKLTIKKTYVVDEQDKNTRTIKETKPFKLRADFTVNDDKKYEVVAGFDIIDREGVSVLGPNTSEAFSKPLVVRRSGTIEAAFDTNPLASGEYSITAAIFNSKATYAYDLVEQATKLNIIGETRHGKIYVEPRWSITEAS